MLRMVSRARYWVVTGQPPANLRRARTGSLGPVIVLKRDWRV